MDVMLENSSIQSDLSGRTITLSLSLLSNGKISFRSCEIIGRGFRNRISFSDVRSIEEVMVARLSNAIATCLRTVSDGSQVLSLPDFLIELPGLALSGLHIMVAEAKNGARNAILRFKEFMGALNHAFRMDIGLHEPGIAHGEKLAINVLADVCLPILNLSRSIDEAHFGSDRRGAREFADRVREFEFQTELLKRYIFNAAMAQGTPDSTMLGSEQTKAFLPR